MIVEDAHSFHLIETVRLFNIEILKAKQSVAFWLGCLLRGFLTESIFALPGCQRLFPLPG